MSANIVKKFLSGNEAISVGAYNAGCSVGTGYPGTPSTEILENFCKYDDVYSEWSVNEKVALEVGLGASLAGARTLVTMKHVGVNVAADPLFTAAYTGIKGGLVIVSADDPNLHSSQNEQDNRNYAKAAKIPALEPSDSQEAYDFTKLAFEISEKFDTPVFLRTTTRIAHSKGTAEYVDSREVLKHREFERNPKKYVMVPAFARERHFVVEDRIKLLAEYAETLDINKVEISNSKIGFITSGISYNYVKESYPDASFLKLGMIYPLPKKKISDFINKMDKVYIVEELDPFFETEIRSYGFTNVEGKRLFPITGEFSPDLIKSAITGEKVENYNIGVKVPPRLPALCP
ncbi:MAG TPA: indolepyruvate ferredoxin oxidoreductase subunit alpha, partial [Spirochaetota bacterium]|nr:indolepyruvate ferredoxin oxidoreductase subunit alpha [Spirochaetota bacterium]